MLFDDFDTQVQCEEVYEYDYFIDHDGLWDQDSDCYVKKEFWYEYFTD